MKMKTKTKTKTISAMCGLRLRFVFVFFSLFGLFRNPKTLGQETDAARREEG